MARPLSPQTLARIMNDDAMIAAYADDRPDLNGLLREHCAEPGRRCDLCYGDVRGECILNKRCIFEASDLHWPSIVLGVLVFGVGLVAVFLP